MTTYTQRATSLTLFFLVFGILGAAALSNLAYYDITASALVVFAVASWAYLMWRNHCAEKNEQQFARVR